MERYIKYKRIEESVTLAELQIIFYDLVADGFEIIHYHEANEYPLLNDSTPKIRVIMVVGKKQSMP
jgi:hypothetical protein